ncbi:hypothetical protein [Actinokineospora sp.]|uniref:hypothetical protein n=1 Tax=Actinokineospora sp. TaxID=1872133 RepID=UPI003D6A176D
MSADQESGQPRVEGRGRADAAKQPQVPVLRGDDLGQLGQAGLRVVSLVGRADPDLVAGADVVVVGQQVQDRPAGVAGVAAPAAPNASPNTPASASPSNKMFPNQCTPRTSGSSTRASPTG